MPKISHNVPYSYSSRNESCENNNMGSNASVHFNDMRGNLMAVNFIPLSSRAVTRVEQTFSSTGTELMWLMSVVFSGRFVYRLSISLRLGTSTSGQGLIQGS